MKKGKEIAKEVVKHAFTQQAISGLVERAKEAAEADHRQEAAFKEEAAAEVDLLAKVVEAVRPGLDSICNRIEGLSVPAVRLGENFYLEEGGTFLEWNESTGLSRPLTHDEVLKDWGPEMIVGELAELLSRQVHGRDRSAAESAERAKKLRALATLLGG
jgi:hypothetical protein